MIIQITDITAEAYEHMVPPEQLYPLDEPGHYCLGAVDEKDGELTAVGILIFDVLEGTNGIDLDIAAVLNWLYVEEAYRGQGYGNALMEELYRILNDAGIYPLICDVPFPAEYNRLCAFLENWGLEFTLVDKFEFRTTLGEVRRNKHFEGKKPTGKVISMADMTAQEWKNLKKVLVKEPMHLEFLENPHFYDGELSCVYCSGDQVQAIFVVRSYKDSILIPELLMGFTSGSSAQLYQLLLYALEKTDGEFGDDAQILVCCQSAGSAALIDGLFPDAEPELVRRGVYIAETEEEEDANAVG